jgi:hypothetical protein
MIAVENTARHSIVVDGEEFQAASIPRRRKRLRIGVGKHIDY